MEAQVVRDVRLEIEALITKGIECGCERVSRFEPIAALGECRRCEGSNAARTAKTSRIS